ncbi:unnamed protein product [Linum trigynum]|uniref:Secreted protein n=1 Tax=Linum trigynum TaxID=586398 RepID=A0AAV2FD12_9ROSI
MRRSSATNLGAVVVLVVFVITLATLAPPATARRLRRENAGTTTSVARWKNTLMRPEGRRSLGDSTAGVDDGSTAGDNMDGTTGSNSAIVGSRAVGVAVHSDDKFVGDKRIADCCYKCCG